MKIKTRLIGLGAVCAALVMISAGSIFYFRLAVSGVTKVADSMDGIQYSLITLRGMTSELIVASDFPKALDRWEAAGKDLGQRILSYVSDPVILDTLTAPADRKILDDLGKIWTIGKNAIDPVAAKARAVMAKRFDVSLYSATTMFRDTETASLISDLASLIVTFDNFFQKTIDASRVISDSRLAAAEATIFIAILAAGFIFAAIAIFMSVMFVARFDKSLGTLAEAADRWKSGDLATGCALSGNDELAVLSRKFQDTVDAFAVLIDGIQNEANRAEILRSEVMSASEETGAAMVQISSNIGSIRKRIDGLSAELGEAAETSHSIGEDASSLEISFTEQASGVETASEAAIRMEVAIDSARAISERNRDAADELAALVAGESGRFSETNAIIAESAQDVSMIIDIVAIINEISDRTNTLSMNAAIEAAHAGESGKGFAVVADEIGKLADSTSENAVMIRDVIEKMAVKTHKIKVSGESTNASFAKMEESSRKTADDMTALARLVGDLAREAEGVAETMKALGKSSLLVQEKAIGIRESSARGAGLSATAERVGTEIRNGMTEIDRGAIDTGDAMIHVRNLVKETSDAIGVLSEKASVYHTGNSCREQGSKNS